MTESQQLRLINALREYHRLIEAGMLVNHSQLCPERRDENAAAFRAADDILREVAP